MKKLEAQKLDLLDPLGSLETLELPTGPHRGRAANPWAVFILTLVLLPRLVQGGEAFEGGSAYSHFWDRSTVITNFGPAYETVP